MAAFGGTAAGLGEDQAVNPKDTSPGGFGKPADPEPPILAEPTSGLPRAAPLAGTSRGAALAPAASGYPPLSARPIDNVGSSRRNPKLMTLRSPRVALEPEQVSVP